MLKKSPNFAIAFSLFIFIITFAVVFTLNFKPLYHFDVDNLSIAEYTGYDRENIIKNYDALISYNSIFNTESLEFDGLAMSEEGRIHFEEVRNIFVLIQVLMGVSFVTSAIGVYFMIKKKNYSFMPITSIMTIAIPSVLGVLIALNWNWFFVTFHQIAFNNDYWIFDPIKDPVITILPNEFFMHCAVMIVFIALLLSALLLVVYKLLTKKLKTD